MPPDDTVDLTPPAPEPTPQPVGGPLARVRDFFTPDRLKLARNVIFAAGWIAAVALAVYRNEAPPPPPVFIEPAPEFTPTQGWIPPDPETLRDSHDPLKTEQFDATPAGKAALGDGDAFLWQPVYKLNGGKLANVNQQSVGCCVGCGFKHAVDFLQATQVVMLGRAAEWRPVAVEVIYAGSRVEVGGGRISGDGSVGAWAAKWVRDGGVLPMAAYPEADLSTFSPARARAWGRSGVPDPLEPAAKEHPVKGVALVKSWVDVQRAVLQGYPVVVCSDQGFTMSRDRDGFARPQGSWAHCMAIVGVKGGNRPGAFILNSWGDQAHTGPVWPADAPVAGFWADAAVIDRMVRQGDSFALSDMASFPTRALNWLVGPVPQRQPGRAALELALAP